MTQSMLKDFYISIGVSGHKSRFFQVLQVHFGTLPKNKVGVFCRRASQRFFRAKPPPVEDDSLAASFQGF